MHKRMVHRYIAIAYLLLTQCPPPTPTTYTHDLHLLTAYTYFVPTNYFLPTTYTYYLYLPTVYTYFLRVNVGLRRLERI